MFKNKIHELKKDIFLIKKTHFYSLIQIIRIVLNTIFN